MITLPARIETERHYDILIGKDILHSMGKQLRKSFPKAQKCLVATDDCVAALYQKPVLASLQSADFDAHFFVFNRLDGNDENVKSMASVEKLYRKLFDLEFNRSSLLVALGGGVVGDMVGFAASTFHRGVPLIYCPTSLLAQVDGSIGGKNAVHLDGITNVIGTFYQPSLVITDIAALATLTDREFWSGFAEVLKIALIADESLLEKIVKSKEVIKKKDFETLQTVVAKAIETKLKLVAQDVHDQHGRRILLNYGHTLGQAFETVAHHDYLRHGEAVALGMIGAAWIGRQLEITPPSYCEYQEDLIRFFELPTQLSIANLGWKALPEELVKTIRKSMDYDKKNTAEAGARFVLPTKIGAGIAVHVEDASLVSRAIQNLLSQ